MSRSAVLIALMLLTFGRSSSAFAQVAGALPGLAAAVDPARPAQIIGLDDDDQGVRSKLHKRIDASWVHVKLDRAVDALQRQLDVPIRLDPEGLDEAGVNKEQEVEFTCHQ